MGLHTLLNKLRTKPQPRPRHPRSSSSLRRDPTLDGQGGGVKGTEANAPQSDPLAISSSPPACTFHPTCTTFPLGKLPPEIILHIFEFTIVDSVLAPATVGKNLSLVSSETRSAGQRLVFGTLSCPRSSAIRLYKHLGRYPHLAQYIETLDFEPSRLTTYGSAKSDHAAMAAVLAICPNISSLGYPMDVPSDSDQLAFTLAPTLPSSIRNISVLVNNFHDLPQTFPALYSAVNHLKHFRLVCPLHSEAPPTRPPFARTLSPSTLSIHLEERGYPQFVDNTVGNLLTYFCADAVRTLTFEVPALTPAVASWLTSTTSLTSLRLIPAKLSATPELFETLVDLLPSLPTLQHLSFKSALPRPFDRPWTTKITHTRVLAALPPQCTNAELLAVELQPAFFPPAPHGGRPDCRAVLVFPTSSGLWDVELGRYMRDGQVEWCEMSRWKVA
ncbi:hypothetical protein JCM10207_006329 [Rhodosporidiobolus poonsookiae]